MNYNLIIIGAGPGGYVCAIRASQLGQKVAIVDKEWLGGICLNVGCVPSKSLLRNAEIAHMLRHRGGEFGFSCENLQLDYGVAVKRSRRVAQRMTKGIAFLMKKNDIAVHKGAARLTSNSSVEVTGTDGAVSTLTAGNIVVATGARPAGPAALSADGQRVLTYREAILQKRLPASVVIVGGGAIGVEFATIWNSYGSQVTIIEMLPRILPLEDEQVGTELTKAFNKSGINVLAGAKVEQLESSGRGVEVSVSTEKGVQTLAAEQALVAVGFAPNSNNLGLDALGVERDDLGFVNVDATMRTNVDGVFAVGDLLPSRGGLLWLQRGRGALGRIRGEDRAL